MYLKIDPAVFQESAIDDDVRAFNASVVELLNGRPDMWSQPASAVRQARVDGKGPFPQEAEEPTAQMISIETESGPLPLRIFQPKTGSAKGSYLHIHGGGWVIGSAYAHDERLQEMADRCRLTCISVDYRLAPEHPYPAGPDDCETTALWLLNQNTHNTDYLAIGGESAGAHLSVVTLLRLRDRHGLTPFHAAQLTAGVFDLGQTASSANWGDERLILNSRDMQMFATRYIQGAQDLRDPDVSPLYNSLEGLPPALFSVGTKDLLLDDTLLMAARWHAASGNAQLDITPGGCHVFQSFRDLDIAKKSNEKIDQFLNEMRPH